MASDDTIKFLSGDRWASAAGSIRANPETFGLTRALGWPLSYQQRDSGKFPELAVFNQRFLEFEDSFRHKLNHGIPEYDARVNYAQHAFCRTDTAIYVAQRANGPTLGNAESPDDTGQTTWREY